MKLPSLLRASAILAVFWTANVLAQSSSPGAAPPSDQSKTPILTRAQLDELLAKPQQLVIIDVRRPDELTTIGGFPELGDLEQRLAWIPKDRKVVTVSNHAGRAGRAGDLLAARGFKVVGRIGVQDYEEAGGKLARIAAPPSPAAAGPSLELATLAARTALEVCTGDGFNVAVSVVDSSGVLKALAAGDGVSARGVQSSTSKALTALTFADATSRLAQRIASHPALGKTIAANPNFNTRAGGVLLKVKDDIVGALGVGGARGSDNDETCALAGVQAIQEQLAAPRTARR
jgi:uncharacterized protein GlcG (DUF336 family)/rhodanese-related sulfurtransferase